MSASKEVISRSWYEAVMTMQNQLAKVDEIKVIPFRSVKKTRALIVKISTG